MKKITVLGAGTMGNGIAHIFAQHNYKVTLVDVSESALKNALNIISSNLDRLIKKEVIGIDVKESTLANISTSLTIEEGAANADLVIEAITENYDVKANIFRQLDHVTPKGCILASNTSSISITKLGSVTSRPEKVIGMHFMNPVPIMKLVEVIKGYATAEETTKAIIDLSKKLNKVPVEVNDYPGFVSNRILMPMINEAIYSLYEGVAGVEEIDTVMKLGMAHPMGPLQLADFIGLDVCLYIMNVLYDGFKNPKYAPCPLLVNMVQAGHKGVKSGEGFYKHDAQTKSMAVSSMFKK
jgi:3-hydroxybutyryl-CoA dehydrogenase